MVITYYSRVWINQVCCQSCSWSAEQGKTTFSCPRSCLRIWSRDMGSAVPSRVGLLISILRLDLGSMIGQMELDTTSRQVLNTTESVGGQILYIICFDIL